MRFLTVLGLLVEGASLAIACNADNCARAVTGTYQTLQGTHLADCQSFAKVTVSPATSTVYATATVYPSTTVSYITTTTAKQTISTSTSVIGSTVTIISTSVTTVTIGASLTVTVQEVEKLKKRTSASPLASTITPSSVPTYASACSGVVRYSSACSCAGVKPTTVTLATPTKTVTNTVSLTKTIVSNVAYSTTVTDIITSTLTTTTTTTTVLTSTTTSAAPVPTGDAYCENGSTVVGESSCSGPGCYVVNLRIEGATGTIYEGPIGSGPEMVTTPSGGTHECDGTNDDANPESGATATTALQDAGGLCGFGFDGTFNPSFDDFFITSIGDTTETSTQFWGLLTDLAFTPVGGCQTEEYNDSIEILWAFDAFNAVNFLKVSPSTAILSAGALMTFTVMGSDGSGNLQAVPGATFGDAMSDASGHVAYTAPSAPGTYRLKATRIDSIRSAAVIITVL